MVSDSTITGQDSEGLEKSGVFLGRVLIGPQRDYILQNGEFAIPKAARQPSKPNSQRVHAAIFYMLAQMGSHGTTSSCQNM